MAPLLSTKRLLLRVIEPDDQRFVFEGLSHPEVIRHYGVRYASFEETAIQMDWYARLLEEGSGCAWKMVEASSGQSVGVISYYFFNPLHNKAEVGFWLLPQFWNKGYGAEALTAMTAYCQNKKGIHRLEAFVEEGNSASGRVLEKAGFCCEGHMRDCERKDGRYISLRVYALLSRSK